MDNKNKIKFKANDIIISLIIPVLLCLIIPLMLNSINSKQIALSERFYIDVKLIVFKYCLFIITYIFMYIFYNLKASSKFINYAVGFLVSFTCVVVLFISNKMMLLDDVNVLIIGGTLFSYLLVGLSVKKSSSYK